MIPHLSTDQLSECILGQPSSLVVRHIETCAACRAELANFREALGNFRGAVRAWSEDQANAVLATPELHPRAASRQLAWALLIAAVCILASIVFPRRVDRTSASDAVLLNQVDAQVSRSVPSSLEPLMKLVVQE